MSLPHQVSEATGLFQDEVDRRLPGRLTGLFLRGSLCWGEFFPGSDVDFVGLWERLPRGEELDALEEAHEAVRARLPETVFDGFHCTPADLGRDPARVSSRPVFYRGRFDPAGGIDINLVTWHELAERPVIARGAVPHVFTDLDRLVEFTRRNLDTYWRDLAEQVQAQGVEEVGHDDDAVAWIALGAPRLHHLLTHRALTSKSGAGRYVRDELDRRWHTLAREALRLRETPTESSLYRDLGRRGRDLHELLGWLVQDGTRPDPARDRTYDDARSLLVQPPPRGYRAGVTSLEQLPRIGAPATRALGAAGYTRLRDLAGVPRALLADLHGVGPKAIDLLQAALEEQGLTLG